MNKKESSIVFFTWGLLIVLVGLGFILFKSCTPESRDKSNSNTNSFSQLPSDEEESNKGKKEFSSSQSNLEKIGTADPKGDSHDTKKTLTSRKDQFKKNFEQTFGLKWKFMQNDKGDIFRISGEGGNKISQQAFDKDTNKLAYTIAKIWGLPMDQTTFQLDEDYLKTPNSTEGKTQPVMYLQNFSNYPVYGGYMKFALSQKDQGVFMINLSLKPTSSTDSLTVSFEQAAAEEVVKRKFKNNVTISKKRGPFYFADSDPHELVWVFNVRVTDPKLDFLELAVGTQTGTIRSQSSTMHN